MQAVAHNGFLYQTPPPLWAGSLVPRLGAKQLILSLLLSLGNLQIHQYATDVVIVMSVVHLGTFR